MKYIIWSLVIIILVTLIATTAGKFLFAKMMRSEVQKELFKNAGNYQSQIVTETDLQGLPSPVQKWLTNAGVIGKQKAQTSRVIQKGILRTDPSKPWSPFEAEQYFNFEEPGFIWFAKINVSPIIHIAGRDKYYDGHGNMQIKLMSTFTLGDAKGKEIDQGSMVRYLAELIWSPAAVLNDYIKWEAVDDRSARATMSYKGVTASGTFEFDEDGYPTGFSAPRFRDIGGKYSLEQWEISLSEYSTFDGIVVPRKASVTWKLSEGDFTWYQLELVELSFN